MYHLENRASFLGKPGASCLARLYGKLVALELAAKDELGHANVAAISHDVPSLLAEIASARAQATPPVAVTDLQSKAVRLGNALRLLSCCGKSGQRTVVPPAQYPYMRYVFHERDGLNPLDVREADLVGIDSLADEIITILTDEYQVTP